MFDTLNVLRGTKLRKVALATAGAVAFLAVAGTGANAADFYFYGDNQTDYLDPSHPASYYPYTGYDDTIGSSKTYTDPGGSGAQVTASAWDRPVGGSTYNPARLVENTRAAADLGLGVKPPNDGNTYYDSSQPLELAKYEVISINLDPNGIYQDASGNFDPTKLTDVVAFFSSIDTSTDYWGNVLSEEMQVATSSSTDPSAVTWSNSYDYTKSSVAGGGYAKGVDLSTLFGAGLQQYLYFRENKYTGGKDDDVLLMQLSYNVGGTTNHGIPEPGALAIFGFGVIGMGCARRRRRAAKKI